MQAADYIVDYLIRQQVTDAFGIPGGVILELLYAMDARKGEFTPHLCYHEQSAGFAACGYAQASGRLGVAYATKGPGFTNLISAMADAYYDSLPVLFITAHTGALVEGMRTLNDQEMDTVSMVKGITKYAARIDSLEDVEKRLSEACFSALGGRKGPVFLDIAAGLLRKDITPTHECYHCVEKFESSDAAHDIISSICIAKRPVILVGDGVNQSQSTQLFRRFVEKAKVPVLSSRFSHDVMGSSLYYFGYVGSHGIRQANFILSKADLIVAIGNRMHYPVNSQSFGAITNRARIIRVDIDEAEFKREIPNSTTYHADLSDVLCRVAQVSGAFGNHQEWLKVCHRLERALQEFDVNVAVEEIASILKRISGNTYIVNDVGNNEFWVSRAAVLCRLTNRTLYSKSFGALGSGLGKTIGAYYATGNPVVCFAGDQGLQMNLQELQYIAQHNLPIAIVVLNNQSSGMIKDRETASGYSYHLHTTTSSGYDAPNFLKIAHAYGIEYHKGSSDVDFNHLIKPLFIEIPIPDFIGLTPSLPKGRDCQDMEPRIDETLYNGLNQL